MSGVTPAAGHAGRTEAAERRVRDVRCARQIMTSRLESEQYANQQQRCAGSPSLRGACRRISHGNSVSERRASEDLRQPMIEVAGRLQHGESIRPASSRR